MSRLVLLAALLVALLAASGVWFFRFTESGRFVWQARVRGRSGPRVERLKSVCDPVVEHDERWVTQEPLHSNFVVVCVLRDGVAPDCLRHLKDYRAGEGDSLNEVTLFETSRSGQRCEARYNRGRYEQKAAP